MNKSFIYCFFAIVYVAMANSLHAQDITGHTWVIQQQTLTANGKELVLYDRTQTSNMADLGKIEYMFLPDSVFSGKGVYGQSINGKWELIGNDLIMDGLHNEFLSLGNTKFSLSRNVIVPDASGVDHPAKVVADFVISDPSSSLETHHAQNSITIFPNPANDVLHIQASTSDPKELWLKIRNIFGQTVTTQKVRATEGAVDESVDLSGLNQGVYFVTLAGGFGESTTKFIKI